MRPAFVSALSVLLSGLLVLGQSGDSPESLVRKLGDPVPPVREQAAEALKKLGKAGLKDLEAGLMNDDAEIRRACRQLVDEIRSDHGPEMEAFLNGTDTGRVPLPGWREFKKVAGDDRVARLAYFQVSRSNPTLLDKLEKDPKQVTAQALEWSSRLWNRQGPVQPGQDRGTQIFEALLATSLHSNLPDDVFNSVYNLLYQTDVRQLVQSDVVLRRLITRILSGRLSDDPNRMIQTAYMVSNLNLHDYQEEHLKPAVLKLVDSLGTGTPDLNRLQQVLQLVQAARLSTALRPQLTPLVRKLVEGAAKSVEDGTAFNNPNALYQASSACQTLGLTDLADDILKPAVRSLIFKLAEKPEDLSRFYQTINLARNLRMETELNLILQPAICRIVAEVSRKPEDENRFNTAYNLARQMNLNEAIEGVLRPAARKKIIAMLEQPADFNRLTQAIYQARNLDLADLLQDTLRPVFARQAATLLETPDMNRIQQCYYLAQNIGDAKLQEDIVKPAFLKLLKTQEGNPNNDNTTQQQFHMARQMGLTQEVLPLARKSALAKQLPGYTRGAAILLLLEFGTKADLAALEPLLSDTTNIGSMGLNRLTLQAEIRDVVLGGLIFKSGKALGDFGFPYFKLIPQLRPFDAGAQSMGFANNEERTAAFKKWEQYKAEKKDEPTP